MKKIPQKLSEILTDVTLREGSQIVSDLRACSVEQKLELFQAQLKTGIRSFELTAFAPGEWFQDASELAKGVLELDLSLVAVKALYFNTRGGEQMKAFPHLRQEGVFHTAATEDYRLKNYNQPSLELALEKLTEFQVWFRENQISFHSMMISTAWGSRATGLLPVEQSMEFIDQLLRKAASQGELPQQVTFADTEGIVNEKALSGLIASFRQLYPEILVGLHLHPQPSEALSLIDAGISAEVDRWEGAWLGVGGSPLANGAGGNLPISSLIEIYDKNGWETGIEKEAVTELMVNLASLLQGE